MLRWLLALLLVPATPALSAGAACPVAAEAVATLDAESVGEWLLDPRCDALAGPLADRAEVLMANGAWADEIDSEGLRWLQLGIAGIRTRIALHDRDIREALLRIDDWEATATAPIVDGEDEFALDDGGLIAARAQALRAILQGAPVTTLTPAFASPEADWVLHFGGCGMGALMFLGAAASMPSTGDAWLARGEHDLALQSLLQEQWTDAMSYGLAPPRLRALAERAWGTGAYEAEVERALQQIEIEWTPRGRVATLPLFGIRLPLPTGTRGWMDESPRWMDSEQQLADFMRERLLQAESVSP